MKEIIKYGAILASICLVASGLLASVYSLTKPQIDSQAQTEVEAALAQVLSGAVRFEAAKVKEEILYYKGYDKKDKIIGVAFHALSKGYSSTIDTLVGMSGEGKIIAIKVISQNETPGLGTRVSEKSFTEQFNNKKLNDLSQVSAITGATISSSALIQSVKEKAEEIQKLLK